MRSWRLVRKMSSRGRAAARVQPQSSSTTDCTRKGPWDVSASTHPAESAGSEPLSWAARSGEEELSTSAPFKSSTVPFWVMVLRLTAASTRPAATSTRRMARGCCTWLGS